MALQGDEADLFRGHHAVLFRDVAGTVPQVSHDTIEDACAFAWLQLLELAGAEDLASDGRLPVYASRMVEASFMTWDRMGRREAR